MRIRSPLAGELTQGESLAVNGVCLTVILAEAGEIHADVGPETLRVTTLGGLARGTLLNLERPMRADGRFGGHLVQGHVDAIGQDVQEVRADSSFRWVTVSFPSQLAPYIIHKGSIAVDGSASRSRGLGTDRFDVQVVPHTVEHTNLKVAQSRDRVNRTCDLVASTLSAPWNWRALRWRRCERVK